MLKNKYIRLASILLIICMVTTCGLSGTLAKYTTGGTSTDSARVAKWGVVLDISGDAFSKTYGDTVSADVKVVAPGTDGNLVNMTVSGKPEVAVAYDLEIDLELDGWVYNDGVNDVVYCPLIFKIGSTTYSMTPEKTLDEFETELEEAVIVALMGDNTDITVSGGASGKTVYMEPGTTLNNTLTVSWEWRFEGGVSFPYQTDEKDTALGILGSMPTISFSLDASITQVD